MSVQLLKDPEVFPSEEVLGKVLDNLYPVFREFINTAESEEFSLISDWHFYKEGKAWLCKISLKKKTVIWLSLWSDCFKIGFYFTEKTGEGIPKLEIDDSLIDFYLNHKAIGKLKPLIVDVKRKDQLPDVKTLIKYKISQL